MASKKQGGKTAQHKRPDGKLLGLKVSDGQKIDAGMVIVRQRGTGFHAGEGVKVGRDHTLYALNSGIIEFGKKQGKKIVSIK